MNWIAQTLWDLLSPARRNGASIASQASVPEVSAPTTPRKKKRPAGKRSHRDAAPAATSDTVAPATVTIPREGTARDRYDALVRQMKQAYGIRVRRWRKSSSGCAWEVHYANGSTVRLIEAPYPRGPVSCAIFLHEVGHHAIGFNTYRLRCLEEYHAWRFALEQMTLWSFNITPSVEKRVHDSLRYAVAKARRRGLRELPAELTRYLHPAEIAAWNAAADRPTGTGRGNSLKIKGFSH